MHLLSLDKVHVVPMLANGCILLCFWPPGGHMSNIHFPFNLPSDFIRDFLLPAGAGKDIDEMSVKPKP